MIFLLIFPILFTEVNADAMVASMGVNPKTVDDSVKNIFTKD